MPFLLLPAVVPWICFAAAAAIISVAGTNRAGYVKAAIAGGVIGIVGAMARLYVVLAVANLDLSPENYSPVSVERLAIGAAGVLTATAFAATAGAAASLWSRPPGANLASCVVTAAAYGLVAATANAVLASSVAVGIPASDGEWLTAAIGMAIIVGIAAAEVTLNVVLAVVAFRYIRRRRQAGATARG